MAQAQPMAGQPRALRIARYSIAAVFVSIGVAHFTHTESFMAIMPPYIPFHRFCVLFSGAAEVAGGLGLLVPSLRRVAGIGLILLLIAVFPANIHMALNNIQVPGSPPIPSWTLWARLPFQLVFAIAVWWVALRPETKTVA